MADYLTTDSELTSIAEAIRTKGGTSAALAYPTEFISAIQAIETVGTYQSKRVTPTESSQIIVPDTGYDALSSVAVAAISSTYVGSGVPTKAAATYTPSTAAQTIAAGQYLSGIQTIAGDSNLVAANIAEGVTIFGIVGTYQGGAAYATMTAGDIAYAATSGWRGTSPSEEVLIWESVTDGWNTSTTLTDSDISAAVALGWR